MGRNDGRDRSRKEYRIILDKAVVKFFKKNPELSRRFNQNYLNSLKCGEFKTLDIKKLQGYKKDYRLRIGKYRFLFVLENDQLLIYFYDADSRGGVY